MDGKDLLKKTSATYNKYYKAYRAAYCRATGLPMYGSKDFAEVQAKELYTKTRAKHDKVQIDESKPVGWYRMQNGYTPLFRAIGDRYYIPGRTSRCLPRENDSQRA